MMNDPAQRRRIILLAVLAVLFLFGFGLVTLISRSGETAVAVNVIAKRPELLVNNKKVRGSTLYLSAGSYTITAQANGFQSSSKTITVDKNKQQLHFLLTPESEDAKNWARDHEEDYLETEAIAGEQTRQEGQNFFSQYPLLGQLPIQDSLYSIDYRVDEQRGATVQIRAPDAMGRQVAIDKIRSMGFDPTNYLIEFVGLGNPFEINTEPGE